MKKLGHLFVLWFAMGMVYVNMEVLWRGNSHPSMLIVGGLCGVCVGAVNQYPRFCRMPIVWQSLIGTFITLLIEFFSGCVLNLLLGLHVWDYTGVFGNVLGQICLPYAIIWFFIMPLAVWLEDYLRWAFWRERKPYTIRSVYMKLITGK